MSHRSFKFVLKFSKPICYHPDALKILDMALPGLNLDALTVPLQEERSSVIHELAAGTEWRFEVAFDQSIDVKVGTIQNAIRTS